MTLLLGIATPRGAWLSSDYLLWHETTGRLDRSSTKQLHLRCKDGSVVLLYTGIGWFSHPVMGDIDVSDWVRRFLRARNLGAFESIERVRDCATRRLGSLAAARSIPHHFVAIEFHAGGLFAAEISNLISGRVETHFEIRRVPVTSSNPVVLIGGRVDAVGSEDVELLRRLVRRTPARTRDYAQVLADINRRAASRSKYVSQACETVYVPARGEPFTGTHHGDAGDEAPLAPMLVFSIDTTDVMRILGERLKVMQPGDERAKEEWDQLYEAAIGTSVQVEDC